MKTAFACQETIDDAPSYPLTERFNLPSPEQAPPLSEADHTVIALDIHPEEEANQAARVTGIHKRIRTVSVHPLAAALGVRHIGPDEMMYRRCYTPKPNRPWTPEEIAFQNFYRFLGYKVNDPNFLVAGIHGNELGVEYAECGIVTTDIAVALAGLLGMRRMLVSDSSFYRAIPGSITVDFRTTEDVLDTMSVGGAFDYYLSRRSPGQMVSYSRQFCSPGEMKFYQSFDINAMEPNGQRIKGAKWEALLEIERFAAEDNFGEIPEGVTPELLAHFGITLPDGKRPLAICWGHRNSSRHYDSLGTTKDPSTGLDVERRFCFGQVAVPINPPVPFFPDRNEPGYLWFPELCKQR